jgi:hypothetical protein
VTGQITDDQHVDIAADVVVAPGVRAEHKRVANARLALEDRAQLGDETDGPRVQLTEGRIQRIRGIHTPHSQWTDAPTLDESLPKQFLERQLYGPRTAVDPAYEIARMELLTRGARQEREQTGFGPGAMYVGHGLMIHPYHYLIRTYLRLPRVAASAVGLMSVS